MNRDRKVYTVLSAQAAGTTTSGYKVSDYRHVMVVFSAAAGTTATIKVKGAFGDTQPTWSTAASSSNEWDYVGTVDLNTGTASNGSTGQSFSAAAGCKHFEVNANAVDWIAFELTISGGSVNVDLVAYDNL